MRLVRYLRWVRWLIRVRLKGAKYHPIRKDQIHTVAKEMSKHKTKTNEKHN